MCKGNNININIIKSKKISELNKNNNNKLQIQSELNNELKMSSHSIHSTDVSEILNKTNISIDEKNLIGNDSFKEIFELLNE